MDITSIRNAHRIVFNNAVNSLVNEGKNAVYAYRSKALKKKYEEFKAQNLHKVSPYNEVYQPNSFVYQYDLEVFIFIYYEELKIAELKLCSEEDRPVVAEFGATGLDRMEHYFNACAIRWPTRKLPDGSLAGIFIRNPWAEDTINAICNYQNVIKFGGAAQGKSYEFIAFMCIMFDHYLYTQKGAQCTYSTVSEAKLKGSTWPYTCTLYPVEPDRQAFSLYAGKAKQCGDYTFKRIHPETGKTIEKGCTFIGILLQKNVKDSRVIDKLTGSHNVEARVYLMDEIQQTDDAPLNAYTNMFLKPKKKWFFGSGNYEEPSDLLGINVEPIKGWSGVDERTHVWEAGLKSRTTNLHLRSCIIHLNNDLSPAIVSEEGAIKFKNCCPTVSQRNELYQTEEARKSYPYKRFWIGFKFEKESASSDYVITKDVIQMSGCYIHKKLTNPLAYGSFDSAPASKDRNVLGIFHIDDGPFINVEKFVTNDKPSNPLVYYEYTTERIITVCKQHDIPSSNIIMDWTNRTALIESLAKKGFKCHGLIYNEGVPSKLKRNEVTGEMDRPIDLATLQRFAGVIEKDIKVFAHQKIVNKISLGAYIFSLFVENGMVGNLNDSLLNNNNSENNFEKEFLLRQFKKKSKTDDRLILVSKDEFKALYRFSPDILDTCFQMFYHFYVNLGVRTFHKKLIGLRNKKENNRVDELANFMHSIPSL